MELVEEIYKLTATFPKRETYGLTDQMRRAATSSALNIAEGSGAGSDKDFSRFLSISLRSNYELMCGMEIAHRLGYCSEMGKQQILDRLEELSAMLSGLRKKLKADI